MTTSEWTICVTAMPTEEALGIAARIADADDPDCEALLFGEGPQVCDVLRCEVLHQAEVIDHLDALLSRQHAILTGVADALRGDPGPLASHSHHDLAERAAALVALLAVTQASLDAASSGRRVTVVDEIERLQRENATLRAAYATDLDGLRAELRRADDERATWRERIERLQRETLRLRSLIPAVAFIRCPSCGTDRDAELDDDAVYVMRRHPRRTTRDEMAWCDGGVVSETKP